MPCSQSNHLRRLELAQCACLLTLLTASMKSGGLVLLGETDALRRSEELLAFWTNLDEQLASNGQRPCLPGEKEGDSCAQCQKEEIV